MVEEDAGESRVDTVTRAPAGSILTTASCAIIAILAIVACSGCSASRKQSLARQSGSPRPIEHVVRRGETVYHIAHVYGVSVQSLLKANHLSDSRDLRVGQSLLIPGSHTDVGAAAHTPDSTIWDVPRASRQFAWPVWSGTVTSGFGMRYGTMHDGVDIAAPVGTPVRAADSGVVVFAGKLHGYGNTVIIRHSDNYVTVYGHNSRILVSAGSRVARGQTIAGVGTSGRTTGPNLHFEVRYDNHAYNPLSYLAPPGPAPSESFARNGSS
ncbi:MAG: peptidoglycan DD-metalloendopeptidase family protein [Candidatus Binataceae bacterium]